MGVRDYTVYDFISRNATLYPEREALVFDENRLTHRAYRERCDQLAAGLVRSGIRSGDRIGVIAHNCDEFMILYGAAAKIGVIVVPVNWRLSRDEVEYVLNDSTPKAVFAGPDFRESVAQAATKVSSIQRCYTMGGGGLPEGFFPFEGLYTEEGAQDEFDIPSDAGFLIMHTAAVEGRPRGALLSQSNIIHINHHLMCNYRLGPDDCHLLMLPLFHMAGLSLSLAVMHAGGKNAIIKRFDPKVALELINREKVTTFFNFAPILGKILETYDQEGLYDLSSIRHISGPDKSANIKRFLDLVPNATYHTGFGQTEAMAVASCPLDEKWGSAGKPTEFSKVALFDDHGKEVPVGSPGEICVRSPTVFLGYWGLEEETAYTFRNGWHHTGDIGRFDGEGYLWYVKRKAEKELIKPGGENVYPAEVEKAILEHENIQEVCVIGVPNPRWREAIKAVCVLKQGKRLEPEDLMGFVASRIARYKKPHHVVYVDALPKNKDGEVDRDQVKKDHGGRY
ncbi:MAG: AMP-binding protein [Pseudomonadota bacterium]